jgi:uncharacterized Zn-binding protein involved in type VI secretion
MPKIARLGDPSSHGGTITSASTTVFADGIGVARSGDEHTCPTHGKSALNSIVTATHANGRLVITVGSTAGCGAIITSGSEKTEAR